MAGFGFGYSLVHTGYGCVDSVVSEKCNSGLMICTPNIKKNDHMQVQKLSCKHGIVVEAH